MREVNEVTILLPSMLLNVAHIFVAKEITHAPTRSIRTIQSVVLCVGFFKVLTYLQVRHYIVRKIEMELSKTCYQP